MPWSKWRTLALMDGHIDLEFGDMALHGHALCRRIDDMMTTHSPNDLRPCGLLGSHFASVMAS